MKREVTEYKCDLCGHVENVKVSIVGWTTINIPSSNSFDFGTEKHICMTCTNQVLKRHKLNEVKG